MNKKIWIGAVFLLMVVPMILAVDININTLGGGHKVSVYAREVGNPKVTYDRALFVSTGSGKITIPLEVSVSEMDLLINLHKDGNLVFGKTFEGISTAEQITINNFFDGVEPELVFGEPEPEVVEEPVVETPVEEVVEDIVDDVEVIDGVVEDTETVKEGVDLMGAVVGLKESVNSKVGYYVMGGFVLLGLLFFGLKMGKKKLDKKPQFNINGPQNIIASGDVDSDVEFQDAERKLDEARKEIDELKNRKKKLNEVRERIKKDREELRRLEVE